MNSNNIILAVSGRKQAGKNSICKFLEEYVTEKHKIVASNFAFADQLKQFCIDILNLDHKQCYGSDADKNSLTSYLWSNMPPYINQMTNAKSIDDQMSARAIMQIFGQLIRDVFGNVWAESTIRNIMKKMDGLQGLMWKPMAIISDTRYPNEVKAVLRYPFGFVLRLTRAPFQDDNHPSESSLDNFDWNKERCFVLDNSSLNLTQQNEIVAGIIDQIVAYSK